jgi:hypothetical protein
MLEIERYSCGAEIFPTRDRVQALQHDTMKGF